MTATYRLKGLGWLAFCVIVALAFYLVSLQVAVERKKLETVDNQITQAHEDIRALQTEFSTRANLAQLERWNGDVLALTSPTAAQYVSSEQALASLDFNAPGDAKVEMASLVIPALPTIVPPPDAARVEAQTPASAARSSAPVMIASAGSVASHVANPVATSVARAAAPVRLASLDRARAEAVAMLDRKLLSDSTLGDIMSGARAETASLR